MAEEIEIAPFVVVVVRGGVVQGARSNRPVTIHVLDYDNMEAAKEEPTAQDEYEQIKEIEGLWKELPLDVL